MRQVFVEHLEGVQGAELEREMFILRKLIEKEKTQRIAALGGDPADFYICTMSNRTIVYKVTHRYQKWLPTLMGVSMPALQFSSTSAVHLIPPCLKVSCRACRISMSQFGQTTLLA